jgi:tetratricopeptide (TPR) repeat protein
MSLTNTWHNNHEESTNKIVLENHEKYLIRNYAEALHLISKINTDIGNYDKSSLKCGECKMMLQKIEIDERDDFLGELEKNIGWNSFKKGNYAEAIRNFENYLFILQDIKGTHNMDFALILNNIGLVHEKSGNYNESLNYFEKSLAIEEAIKGKYSIEYAATLENIGLAYLNQGYYAKAI